MQYKAEIKLIWHFILKLQLNYFANIIFTNIHAIKCTLLFIFQRYQLLKIYINKNH